MRLYYAFAFYSTPNSRSNTFSNSAIFKSSVKTLLQYRIKQNKPKDVWLWCQNNNFRVPTNKNYLSQTFFNLWDSAKLFESQLCLTKKPIYIVLLNNIIRFCPPFRSIRNIQNAPSLLLILSPSSAQKQS